MTEDRHTERARRYNGHVKPCDCARCTRLAAEFRADAEALEKAEGKALAWDDIERRADEAHAIAQRAAKLNAKWYGHNVWHVVLEEVKRLDSALESERATSARLKESIEALQARHYGRMPDDVAKLFSTALEATAESTEKWLAEVREKVRAECAVVAMFYIPGVTQSTQADRAPNLRTAWEWGVAWAASQIASALGGSPEGGGK